MVLPKVRAWEFVGFCWRLTNLPYALLSVGQKHYALYVERLWMTNQRFVRTMFDSIIFG